MTNKDRIVSLVYYAAIVGVGTYAILRWYS